MVPKDIDNLENVSAFFDSDEEGSIAITITLTNSVEQHIANLSVEEHDTDQDQNASPESEITVSNEKLVHSASPINGKEKATPHLLNESLTPVQETDHFELHVDNDDPIPLDFDEADREIVTDNLPSPSSQKSPHNKHETPKQKPNKEDEEEPLQEHGTAEEEEAVQVKKPKKTTRTPRVSITAENVEEEEQPRKTKKSSRRRSIEEEPESPVTADKENYVEVINHVDDGRRRSNRRKIPPLEYWRNEKVVYGRNKSPLASVVDVVRIPHNTPLHPRPRKQRKLNPDGTVSH